MSSNKMNEQEERWGKRNKEKEEIQQLYEFNEKHFDQGSEAYGQLIAAVEKYSSKAIWAVLNNSPYNTREDYEDVLMRGRESFLQENNNVFFNYKNKEDVRKTVMFSDYARGMYQRKAFDHIKKRKRNSELDPVPEDIYIENGYNNQIPSAGEVLIDYYAKAVMNSDANPFHIIFLCYSKMLPVVLGETRCNSADGWAWEHMQGKTMFRLSDLFVRMFNSAVRMIRVTFGKPYCDKLEKPFKDDKTGQLYEKLGEVILTSLYEQSNTKNWVARLNKKIMAKVVSEIMNAADSDEDAKRAATEAIAYTIGR